VIDINVWKPARRHREQVGAIAERGGA
jgi:hypothetical protein